MILLMLASGRSAPSRADSSPPGPSALMSCTNTTEAASPIAVKAATGAR